MTYNIKHFFNYNTYKEDRSLKFITVEGVTGSNPLFTIEKVVLD